MAREGSAQTKSVVSSTYDAASYIPSQVIEVMTNKELVKLVENETRINRQIFLENDVFERYLSRVEPPALQNLTQMMISAANTQAHQQRVHSMASKIGGLTTAPSTMSVANVRKPGLELMKSTVSMATIAFGLKSAASTTRNMPAIKEGPTINLSHKIDMCTREMEELRLSYEQLTKVCKIKKAHLIAAIEEISTMRGEIDNTSTAFEQKVIIDGVEEITKKIPASVFVRFMEEWLRKMDLLSGQLRLKTNTYKTSLKKLSKQLEEKIELGDSLRPVDFEFQEIIMLETAKQLNAKTFDLNLLKKDTSNTHREFIAFQDRLTAQVTELQTLKANTEEQEKIIEEMEKELDIVDVDIAEAEKDLMRIQNYRKMFTVPDVLEYATAKERIYKLRRELKVWNRRSELQHKLLISIRQKVYRLKRELIVS